MIDIQSSADERGIPLRAAGISKLKYPMVVWDRDQKSQQTIGNFTLTVDLPHQYKGTHMSRFIEALERHRGEISLSTLPLLVQDLRETLDAARSHVRVDFSYFIQRKAPATGAASMLELRCYFLGDADRDIEMARNGLIGTSIRITNSRPDTSSPTFRAPSLPLPHFLKIILLLNFLYLAGGVYFLFIRC